MQGKSISYMDLKVSPEEAKKLIGKVVKVDKRNREFISKLVALENNDQVLVFQTKSGKLIKDPLCAILLMQEV